MRIGSHKVPFRVMIAVITLSGLGALAAFPSQEDALVDPIITASTDKTDTSAPTQTDLPADLEAEAMPAPRQVLPQVEPVPVAQPQTPANRPTPTVAAEEVVVAPVMTDTRVVPQQPVAQNTETASLQQMWPFNRQAAGLSSMDPQIAGDAIVLALDHARIMRLEGDVGTIIVGNPAIADAAMPDPRTVILTGKSYGETNLVLLDQDGEILAEQMLRVTVRGQSLVSVYRGVQRTTLSCSPTCEIRPTPGDNTDQINAGMSAFQARNAAALEAVRAQQ